MFSFIRFTLSLLGLIILNAWFGKFVTDNSRKHERAKVIDVTVPLQCLVKDSKLILTEATKVRKCSRENATAAPDFTSSFQSGLPGFYDPCVGEEKSLKVLYQFRGVMHQVVSGDSEPLRIPKQCKLLRHGVVERLASMVQWKNTPVCICGLIQFFLFAFPSCSPQD